jgi:hypothetical protein
MINNNTILNHLVSPVRMIDARVELYNGSTLINSFSCRDKLIEFSIERVSEENKFFGFGIIQRLNVKLIDQYRELSISSANSLRIVYEIAGQEVSPYPTFTPSEVNRDENTNELSITAYDKLNAVASKTVGELTLTAPYTTIGFITAATVLLGCKAWRTVDLDVSETAFTTSFADGGNFEGTELLRVGLDDIAEITQSFYFIDKDDYLVFKRLNKNAAPVLHLSKSEYYKLTSGIEHKLSQICKTTELGDNIISSAVGTGNTQYIRDNAFYELINGVSNLLEEAIAKIGGLAINQFDCSWRGNVLLEPGDKISMETKNGGTITAYILDDVIDYAGYLEEKTKWEYNPEEGTDANPATIGEMLD